MANPPGKALDAGCPIEWGHPLNRSLVYQFWASPLLPGCWGGGTARDLVRGVRTPHDGTVWTGTRAWAAGGRTPGSGALLLDSVTYTTVGRVSTLTDNFSVFGLVTFDQTAGTGQRLFFYNGDDAGGWGIGQANDSSPGGLFGSVAWVGSGAAIPTGVYSVGLARVAGTTTVYLNGLAAGSTSASTPNAPSNTGLLGNEDTGQTRQWKGKVFQVSVFEAGFSASEAYLWHDEAVKENPNRARWYTPRSWAFGAGGASPPPPSTTYPQLERGVRGLSRGMAIGGFR